MSESNDNSKDENNTETGNMNPTEDFKAGSVTGEGPSRQGGKESDDLPDSVGESLEALVSVVLDSAEVANRSANVAASSTGSLNSGIEKLNTAAKKNARNSFYILGICGFFLIIAAMLFVFMTTKLNSRIGQVDAMLLAVGKRVLEMDSGVDALGEMQSTLDKFNVEQLELQEKVNNSQEELKSQIAEAVTASNSLVTAVPEETANQVQKRTDGMLKELKALSGKLKEQEEIISNLKTDFKLEISDVTENMKQVEATLKEVSSVKREIEALVVIEKERYLDTLQKGWELEKKVREDAAKAKKIALRKETVIKELRYPPTDKKKPNGN